jgi:hypothetical protein
MDYTTVILIVVLLVSGSVGILLAVRQYRLENKHIRAFSLQHSFYVYFGITAYLAAIFFFLVSFHDLLPNNAVEFRLLVYIFAGIVILGSCISIVFAIRSLIVSFIYSLRK